MDNPVITVFGLFLQLIILAVVIGVVILFARSIFWITALVVGRISGFVLGVFGDLALLALNLAGIFVHAFLAVLWLVIGRWQPANVRADRFGASLASALGGIVSIVLCRPLRLFGLDRYATGLVAALPSGVIDCRRLTQADARVTMLRRTSNASIGAPVDSRVSSVHGSFPGFDGYSIVGSLPSGGSGAQLWVAEPSDSKCRRLRGGPGRVVIKSFDLQAGSSLPSIVRESRALEGARRIGLVLEHRLEDERFWYVMPYHPGPTLTQMVDVLHRSHGAQGFSGVELGSALNYIRDLLNTLSYFHESGLWHKDVKPDNLIVHDGKAHLVDLGLVSSLSSGLTLTTHGTEYFRDPELVRMALRGVKVHEIDGAKFDVFGAGAVLYFVLANDFPAQGGLSRFHTPVPPVLDWIVRRAMADYAQRYATADEMLADLDAVCRHADIWAMLPADLPSLSGRPAPAVAATGSLEASTVETGPRSVLPPPVAFPDNKSSSTAKAVDSVSSPTPVPASRGRLSPMLLVLGLIALLAVCMLFWTLSTGDSRRFITMTGVDHHTEFDADVAFLMGIDGPVLSGASGTVITPEVEKEARILPDQGLAVLGLRGTRFADDSLILIWDPGLMEKGSHAASEFERMFVALVLEEGYAWRNVPEPQFTSELLAELEDFPTPVTLFDGSPAPRMGIFRIADRLGLEKFLFFGESGDENLGITTFSEDDEPWELSVRLPPRLN
ncbi:MAG: hypothetical protein VX641_05590 [Planctomycetota bacterium]|nr:hypothetical protein [Planctomycetota bacterium]